VPGAAEQNEIWPPAEREGMIMMRKIIAALTGILAVVYFGGVVLAQQLFRAATGQTSDFAIVISTLLIAAL
jgi:hypothetical protein